MSSRKVSDVLLYGHDATERIVAVQAMTDHPSKTGHVQVYHRSEDTHSVHISEVPFYPFFFLSNIELLGGFSRTKFQFQALEGDLHFRYLVVFTNWKEYWAAQRHVDRKASTSDESSPSYTVSSPGQQYLMQSGRTCFKGMQFDDLHRLQLDIECISELDFPNADRLEDRIILIALSDNKGWRQVLGAPEWSEERLLQTMVETIQEINPDVIEGHNIFRFDFPYILRRCALHGVVCAIGRDRSEPRTFATSTRFAERSFDFTALDIAGRHVIDTFFQVMTYDVVKRDLPGYGLKEVSKYFGFAPADRTYIDGSQITELWKSDPSLVIRYALDDVIETERLARHLSESTFYLTQMLPMEYGQVSRVGPASKIESLFVREYLRKKHSLPRSEWGAQTQGGYTDIFFTGVTGPIVYADVESLYPSIMLNYDIKPSSDSLLLFPKLLKKLTDLRLAAKSEMQHAISGELKSALDARQNSYKVIINSFYGFLGFSQALFNDFSEADRVAITGQNLLLSIIQKVEERGGKVLEVDTDGVLFVPPSEVHGEAAELGFISDLNQEMPEGIRIGFDGRYKKMLSYKKKNYALEPYEGDLKLKGSSLVSRAIEPFGRRFVRKTIGQLLENDIQGIHEAYLDTRNHIIDHKWNDVAEFARTETLKDSLKKYQRDIGEGKRTRSAPYELALARKRTTLQPIQKGDRVSYYVAGSADSGPAFESARLAEEWNIDRPDENTAYYLRRFDDVCSKFEVFFEPHHFRSIFSKEDLFGFDPAPIKIKNQDFPLPSFLTSTTFEQDAEEF